MRMKALNHEERRKAIWRFVASLTPFLITMPLFVYVFCFTSERHSIYIENRHGKKEIAYSEQAIHEQRIDTVVTRTREIVKGDKQDHEYKETQRSLNSTIQDGLGATSNGKEPDPYEDVFEGTREVMAVVDSIYDVKSDLIPARRQLDKLMEYYNKRRLSLSK